MFSSSRVRLRACMLAIALAPIPGSWALDCRPEIGTPAHEVLRACGEPKQRYVASLTDAGIVHREWDYVDTIVGLIDERVAYVLDMKN